MMSYSVSNLKPGWWFGYQHWSAGSDNGLTVISQWTSIDCSNTRWLEKAAGLNFHHLFFGQQRLGKKTTEPGVSTIYTHLLVGQGVQPDSGLTHTFKHTAAHGRIRAFLPMSCRGGSAHVHCWLSNLSNQC